MSLSEDHSNRISFNRGWFGVATIAAATFLLVTTECLPIGLLSKMAQEIGVTEGQAGLSITVPGIVAAVAAPLLTVGAGRLDRRSILWLMTALIVVSNIIAALSEDFTTLLLGRTLLGVGVGGLWSFGIAVGRRLVPEASGGRATALISAGIGMGTVIGVPAGSAIGAWLGWREAFAITSGFGILVLLSQVVFLPKLPAKEAIRLSQIVLILRLPKARAGLIGTLIVVMGHFLAYTFLEPFLRGVTQLHQFALTSALVVFATAGVAGAFIGEAVAKTNYRRAFIGFVLVQVVALLLAALAGQLALTAFVAVAVWGFAFGAVPVCSQIWMYHSSGNHYEGGSAMIVTFIQVGLSLGSFVGGYVFDQIGTVDDFLIAAAVSLLTVAVLSSTSVRKRTLKLSEAKVD